MVPLSEHHRQLPSNRVVFSADVNSVTKRLCFVNSGHFLVLFSPLAYWSLANEYRAFGMYIIYEGSLTGISLCSSSSLHCFLSTQYSHYLYCVGAGPTAKGLLKPRLATSQGRALICMHIENSRAPYRTCYYLYYRIILHANDDGS